MRFSFVFLLSSILLGGCGPGIDPNLEKPCDQRGPAAVTVGTGEEEFQPISASGVRVNYGDQGGSHIWIGLSCKNLGPKAILSYGVRDVETGQDLDEGSLKEVVELVYDEASGTDRAGGIYGYLRQGYYGEGPPPDDFVDPSELGGRAVLLWADVTDECHDEPVHGEAEATVAGG